MPQGEGLPDTSIAENDMASLNSELRIGGLLPHLAGRLGRAGLALALVAALSSCVAGQDKSPPAKSEPKADGKDQKPTVAKGEIVSEMPKDLGHVFQAKDGRHWFSSGSEGAFRYDGKTITRFTKKDGLAGDGVGGVQEDKSGNLYFSTNGGISKFDGQSFTTLEPKATGEWKNQPDDLWFGGGQDSGVVYRYDGKSLHRLAFPKTKAGDDATLPRDKFPNAKYSPYDVYTIFKDSKGHLWFGTAVLGACRYDGKSFTWIPEEELRNDYFGTRSIIEDKDGKFWFSNTLHRYAIDRSAAVGQGDASQWYKKEKGIGDLSGHKQEEYELLHVEHAGRRRRDVDGDSRRRRLALRREDDDSLPRHRKRQTPLDFFDLQRQPGRALARHASPRRLSLQRQVVREVQAVRTASGAATTNS